MRKRAFLSGILLAPTLTRFYGGDDDGAGGGDGKGGDGSNKPSGAGEQATGLTEQQVNKLINAAINGRNQQLITQLESRQAKAFEDLTTRLTESFTGLLTETLSKQPPEEPGQKGKQAPPPTDFTQSPEFKKLQKRLEDQERQLTEAKTEKENERRAKREADFNRQVEAELARLGVQDPEGARLVLQGRKRVKFKADDDDSIIYVDAKGVEEDLSDGLSEWAKSADGKRFMPPSGASGSGERGGGGKKPAASSNGVVSSQELGEALAREMGVTLTG